MTDRDPTDDDRVLEAFEAAGARGRGPATRVSDPALADEIEGVRAVQTLLRADAQWGEASGTDMPPPHLLDAIVRAEVAARPDAIRHAVAASAGGAPAAPAAGLWSKLSSWAVGGGVVVAAAAAVVVTISRGPSELTSPTPADASPRGSAEAVAPSVAFAPPSGQVQAAVGRGDDGGEEGTVDVGAYRERATLEQARERDTRGDDTDAALPRKALASKDARVTDTFGGGPAEVRARKAEAAPVSSSSSSSSSSSWSPPPPPASAPASAPSPAEAKSAPTQGMATADDAPDNEPERLSSAPAAPSPSAPQVISAADAAANFLTKKAAAKEAAMDAMKTDGADAKGALSRRSVAEEARASALRDRRLQEANGVLVTAERELQLGRFANALDLANQAEAIAGGGLGLAPTSTQVRAAVGLGRSAQASTLAARLLTVPASTTQLVDGLLAGAEAATAIGDDRLRMRLLTKAASKENPDPARRAEAQRRLSAPVPVLKAKARSTTEAAADANADANAAPVARP
jgi:hypothetical protein